MRCRDFFVHLYKDASGDYWEFDSVTWEGVAAEPLRWRIRSEGNGATLMSGCLDSDSGEVLWTDVETEGTLELAMLNVVDRVFSEAGGLHEGWEPDPDTEHVDQGNENGQDNWADALQGRQLSAADLCLGPD